MRGYWDNSEIIFHIFHENICCDPSFEPFSGTVLMMVATYVLK